MNEHTFTVGERVAVMAPYGWGIQAIAKIDRITPSGQIVVGKSKYWPDGSKIGASGRWDQDRIAPLTPEREREWWRARAVSRLQSLTESHWAALTDEQLRAIVAVLDGGKE